MLCARPRRQVVASALCLLAACGADAARRAPQDPSNIAGYLGGVVTESTCGRPLGGVGVVVTGPSVGQAETGQDGRYVIRSLAAGTYTVEFHGGGYAEAYERVTVQPSVGAAVDAGLVPLPGVIAGTVTGGITSDVIVHLGGRGTAMTRPTSAGCYVFTSLADGDYSVTPSLADHAFAPPTWNGSVAGATVAGVNFAMTQCAAPLAVCANTCTNLSNDPLHCGGCTNACGEKQVCSAGLCRDVCVPNCAATGRVCGDDGCGGSCGSCEAGSRCDGSGQCQTSYTPVSCPTPTGSVIHVRSGASGTPDGSTSSPYPTLTAALAASSRNATFRIAGGTYTGPFTWPSGARSFCGGYSADFSVRDPRSHPSILTAAGAAVVSTPDHPAGSSFTGVTVRGGTQGIRLNGYSAALFDPRVEIADVIVENNSGNSCGAGIAGMVAFRVYRSVIRNNNSGTAVGGGICANNAPAVLEENLVEGNRNTNHGGGFWSNAAATVTRNVFRNNTAGWGGGVLLAGTGTTSSWNTYVGNLAIHRGGGLFVDEGGAAVSEHELVYGNSCSGEQGIGVMADGPNTVFTLRNSDVFGHDCAGKVGTGLLVAASSDVVVENCIFWNTGGSSEVISQSSDNVVRISYSLMSTAPTGPGISASNNLIGLNPLFADAASGDSHLKSAWGRFVPSANAWVNDAVTSPAINAGNPLSDYALEPAPNGGRINMGLDGNTAEASRAP